MVSKFEIFFFKFLINIFHSKMGTLIFLRPYHIDLSNSEQSNYLNHDKKSLEFIFFECPKIFIHL